MERFTRELEAAARHGRPRSQSDPGIEKLGVVLPKLNPSATIPAELACVMSRDIQAASAQSYVILSPLAAGRPACSRTQSHQAARWSRTQRERQTDRERGEQRTSQSRSLTQPSKLDSRDAGRWRACADTSIQCCSSPRPPKPNRLTCRRIRLVVMLRWRSAREVLGCGARESARVAHTPSVRPEPCHDEPRVIADGLCEPLQGPHMPRTAPSQTNAPQRAERPPSHSGTPAGASVPGLFYGSAHPMLQPAPLPTTVHHSWQGTCRTACSAGPRKRGPPLRPPATSSAQSTWLAATCPS